jgi:hypothetical protein
MAGSAGRYRECEGGLDHAPDIFCSVASTCLNIAAASAYRPSA